MAFTKQNSNVRFAASVSPDEVDADLEAQHGITSHDVISTVVDYKNGALGGSILVEDEGVSTVAAATALNFVGAGVTVTDGGGGGATVTIPGGGGTSVPIGTLDLSQSPYSVVMNSTAAAAANGAALAQAITDAAGVKEIVFPVGTLWVDPPTDPGVLGTQTYRYTYTTDLFMRGAVRGKSILAMNTGYTNYRITMFHGTTATANTIIRDLTFQGPSVMPTPMPCFQRIDSHYTQVVLDRNNASGSLYLDNVKTTGLWSVGFNNQGSTFAGGGQVTYKNCDIFGIDECSTVFSDATATGWGQSYRFDAENCKFRSHEFYTRSFATAATFSGSTVTVTCDRVHQLVAGDTFRLPGGLPGITGLSTSSYTVVSAPSVYTLTFTQAGVGGSYTGYPLGTVFKNTNMEFAISAATFSGSTVTITTSAAMDLVPSAAGGQETVYLPDGIPGLTGIATDLYHHSSFNVASVIDSTHFTITVPGVGGAYTSGGFVALQWTDNGLGVYASPNGNVNMRFCGFYGGCRESIKMFTSSAPATTPMALEQIFVGCGFYSGGNGIQTSNIGSVHTIVSSCVFGGSGGGINAMSLAGSTLKVIGCEFKTGRGAIGVATTSPTDVEIIGGHFNLPNDTSYTGVSNPVVQTTAAVSIKITNAIFNVNGNNEYISVFNNAASYADIRDCTFNGGANRTNISGIVISGYTRVRGCRWIGAQNFIFTYGSAATQVDLSDNDFLQATGGFTLTLATTAGIIRGRGNYYGGTFPSWTTVATGPLIKAMEGQNPTVVTSAASTSLSPNYDMHHLAVGVATNVDNLFIGTTANSNRYFGGTRLTVIADDVNTTLRHNGAGTGNIRLKGGVNVTMAVGEIRTFIFDATNDVWRET